MSDPLYALQVAQAAALLADAGIIGLVGKGVYDPLSAANRPYDYICVGDDQDVGEPNTCTELGELYSTIHVWTQGPAGRLRAKQIMGEARRVLTQALTLDGHQMLSAVFQSAQVLPGLDDTNPDARVSHGVLIIHYRTVPVT